MQISSSVHVSGKLWVISIYQYTRENEDAVSETFVNIHKYFVLINEGQL